MSTIRKKPEIETIIESLSDAEKSALVSCINATGPLTNKSLIDQNLFFEALGKDEYDISGVLLQVAPTTTLPGIVIRVADGEWFIEIGNDQKLVMYVLDTENRNIRKIDELLNINELRTVLNDSILKGDVDDMTKDYIINTVEEEQSLQVFENIVDKDGHKRFLEGNIALRTISGLTPTYGKWSLSGSHLLIVFAFDVENTTAIANNTTLADCPLPKWIYDKIVALFGNIIDRKTFTLWANDYSTQSINVFMLKSTSEDSLFFQCNNIILSADRHVRIAFDLLIDNE